jgi:hypothetical protein
VLTLITLAARLSSITGFIGDNEAKKNGGCCSTALLNNTWYEHRVSCPLAMSRIADAEMLLV